MDREFQKISPIQAKRKKTIRNKQIIILHYVISVLTVQMNDASKRKLKIMQLEREVSEYTKGATRRRRKQTESRKAANREAEDITSRNSW